MTSKTLVNATPVPFPPKARAVPSTGVIDAVELLGTVNTLYLPVVIVSVPEDAVTLITSSIARPCAADESVVIKSVAVVKVQLAKEVA